MGFINTEEIAENNAANFLDVEIGYKPVLTILGKNFTVLYT